MKEDYDADKIIALLRDIRRNYLDSKSNWRPWCEGNDKVFRDPKILPEVRLLAEAQLTKEPMLPHIIQTMATVEDEEHLDEFLSKHTTSFDCSERSLRFLRYLSRWDCEKFEQERRYGLYEACGVLLAPRYYTPLTEDKENQAKAAAFMENILTLIRDSAVDDRPDMWVDGRLRMGMTSAIYAINDHKVEEALSKLNVVVKLLEETMNITNGITLPTSCCFLDGMVWNAQEDWHTPDNNPDTLEEREIYIYTRMSNLSICYCIYPSQYWEALRGKEFEPLHGHPEFESLCDRVKNLIVTKSKEA